MEYKAFCFINNSKLVNFTPRRTTMLDDFRDNDEDLDKGNEFLDEFRQRLNSQSIENIEERKNDINRSQHVFIGTVLGIGLAGIVSWFILSPNYKNVKDVEIPVIRRPHTATKIQPADPGGMEILNQDKTVYDIVEKKDTNETTVENLLPPPEEPKLPVAVSSENETLLQTNDVIVENAEKIIATEEQKEILKQNTNTEKAITNEVKITEDKNTKAIEKTKIESVETKKSVEVKVVDKTPAKENKAETSNQSIPNGLWQIQLISSPNKSAMDKAWVDLTKKHSGLNGLPHEIESADLGSKGTFYRLKAGAFKNRSDADKLCNSIKSAGGTCLVKKK